MCEKNIKQSSKYEREVNKMICGRKFSVFKLYSLSMFSAKKIIN